MRSWKSYRGVCCSGVDCVTTGTGGPASRDWPASLRTRSANRGGLGRVVYRPGA